MKRALKNVEHVGAIKITGRGTFGNWEASFKVGGVEYCAMKQGGINLWAFPERLQFTYEGQKTIDRVLTDELQRRLRQ